MSKHFFILDLMTVDEKFKFTLLDNFILYERISNSIYLTV